MTADELFETVRHLPVAVQRDLMLMIRENIRDHVAPDGLWYEDSPEFLVELERRIQDARAHPEKSIPAEVVMKQLREQLAETELRERRRRKRN